MIGRLVYAHTSTVVKNCAVCPKHLHLEQHTQTLKPKNSARLDPEPRRYRASCWFTLLLGILWIVANYCDILTKLNYAEGGHEMM